MTPYGDGDIVRRKQFYSHFIRADELVFDVGANVGNRTEAFLALEASVIAVEPNGECVRALKERQGQEPKLTVLETALGSKEGEAELLIPTEHTMGTMSREWIDQVTSSGRFADLAWSKSVRVSVTTLDRLIKQYGLPQFCKIDVEGYEYEVLQGLSMPIPALSFEYAKEHLASTIACIHHLQGLGNYLFNLSFGESMQFESEQWLTGDEIQQILHKTAEEPEGDWGDVYAVHT